MINNNNNFSGIDSMSASVYYGDGQYLTGISSGTSGTSGYNGTSGTSGLNGATGSNGISGGQAYYFNQSATSSISPYRVLTTEPSPNGGSIVTQTIPGSSTVMMSSFITPQLGFAVIPGGSQRFHIHILKPAENDEIECYCTIQLSDSSGTPIGATISTNNNLILWVDAVTPSEAIVDIVLPTTTIDPTNRMIVKIFCINNDATSHSVKFYTEGATYYSFVTTTTGVVSSTSGTSGTSQTAAGSFGITVDGGGSVIPTGLRGFVVIPYSGTITEWTIIADQSGSSVVDIWKSTYAGAPPTIANTITGSALPTLTTSQKAQSSTLTGWTTSVTTGDVIGFNVDSASTITRLNLSIKITKS